MGTVSPLTHFQHIRFSFPLQPILLRSLVLGCTTLVKQEPCRERDQSSAIGSTLARRRQQDVSQPALLAWVVYWGRGLLPQSWEKKVGL